jgi:two-component system cell cycle response regulator
MQSRSGQSRSGRPDLHVLVVEDDAAARSALVALVGTFGVDVREARDGEEAYRLALERRPDLVLCDLQMPVLDGLGLVQRLRRDPRFRRVLAVAVGEATRPIDIKGTREAGFDGHIAKPVSAEVVARLLDRALDRQLTQEEPQGA